MKSLTSRVLGARPNFQFPSWSRAAAAATLALLSVCEAQAQATGAAVGQDAWNAVKNLWFGPPGLVLGAAVLGLAVYFFFKEGVLAVLGVIAIGTFFFFVPSIVLSLQNWAKTF